MALESRNEGESLRRPSESGEPQSPSDELRSTIEGHLLSQPCKEGLEHSVEDVEAATQPSLEESIVEVIPLFAQLEVRGARVESLERVTKSLMDFLSKGVSRLAAYM
ncbi:hypothetical protein F2P56_017771 [Juglans regia]|uniref:Uncharacterized protein n=1 Tax=Juglans regia TaxID=51240 RepID=A0A833XAP6_JUGRE|nr:hypothetical protein F2P56_017771 [Juglans regia]